VDLIEVDGAEGEGGGQILRTALTLAAVTGQAFKVERIRASRLRPGLRPQHLAAVRAAAMSCGAEVKGAFDGSPDLRFMPNPVAPGEFDFDIGTAGAVSLVLETVVPILAAGAAESTVAVVGGTHVPRSPSFHFLAGSWAPTVERLGLGASLSLERTGFHPRGGGQVRATVRPWARPAAFLDLSRRGQLRSVRGVAGSAHVRGDVASRAAGAARRLLWEQRRIESEWEVVEATAASPGAYLYLEAVFDCGRAGFSLLGERGLRAEVLGERAARSLLRFLEDEEATVDPWLADQLAVPLALAGGGGRLLTSEVTRHLETVATVVSRFGVPARTWGRRGGPGGMEVERH
jgi:RNA 3'-terminal phosphate cyclase (ATP)